MNYFSVALPFDYEQIEDLSEFNSTLSKSTISDFYSALPIGNEDNSGYEQNRGYYPEVRNLEEFLSFVKYGKSKGIDFIYLFNSARGFQIESSWSTESFKKLEKIVNGLGEIGCNKFKVGNTQVLDYILRVNPNAKILLSTVLGYKDINQFKTIKERYPNISTAVMVYDSNRNFPLMENIQKLGIKVKVMVNEGCMSGCPYRHSHDVFPVFKTSNNKEIEELWNTEQIRTFTSNCTSKMMEDIWNYVVKSSVIYPFQIKEYNKSGINYFKIAGRGEVSMKSGFQSNFIKNYLNMVEGNMSDLEAPVFYFNRAMWYVNSFAYNDPNPILLKDVVKFLPKLKHFKSNGDKCASQCGFGCNYCNKCADMIESKYPMKGK